jgi:hypothetical protein
VVFEATGSTLGSQWPQKLFFSEYSAEFRVAYWTGENCHSYHVITIFFEFLVVPCNKLHRKISYFLTHTFSSLYILYKLLSSQAFSFFVT